MQSAVTRIPVASFQDHNKTGQIIIEPLTHLPYCDLCNSFNCIHVKYAMSYKQARINFNESLKLICSKCGNYNSKGANYCDQCGSRLRGVD